MHAKAREVRQADSTRSRQQESLEENQMHAQTGQEA